MSYIGNGPDVNSFTIKVEKFSGTGACTTFTLARDLDSADDIQVTVNGVLQEPTDSYSLLNGIITFTEAPSLGANNISVRYLAPVVLTYNQVNQSQILAGSIGTTQLATSAVTNEKIAFDTMFGNKIAPNQITGNLIKSSTIAGNAIITGTITGNLIASNTIAGNAIGTGQITGNLIRSGTIAGNAIIAGTITGNLIGLNAVSGNNIVSPPDIFDDAFLFGGM